MSQKTKQDITLKKCQLILGLFQDMFPRPYLVEPTQNSTSKQKNSSAKKPFRFSTDLRDQKKSHNKSRSSSNISFRSIYSKQSRLDRIMKIKPTKVPFAPKIRPKANLNSSFSSSCSAKSNKQNKTNNFSRLERIMNLKVTKPKVCSTLKQYKPYQSQKITPTKNKHSSILEMKQCRKQIERRSKQKQKQDRLWETFERERWQHTSQSKRQKQRKESQERRVQRKVQSLVQKTMNKIKVEKELALRKKKIFNDYLY